MRPIAARRVPAFPFAPLRALVRLALMLRPAAMVRDVVFAAAVRFAPVPVARVAGLVLRDETLFADVRLVLAEVVLRPACDPLARRPPLAGVELPVGRALFALLDVVRRVFALGVVRILL